MRRIVLVILFAFPISCNTDLTGPNRAPVAVAPADVITPVEHTVNLSAAASYDPDGDELTYSWTMLAVPAGSTAGLAHLLQIDTSFVPDRPGYYLIGLGVTDGVLRSDRAVVQVLARSACQHDDECDDGNDCTDDSCQQGTCAFEPIAGCDECPNDPAKTDPGQCGCGVPDTDSDSDGTADCLDDCPDDPAKTDPGACGCGVPEGQCGDLCPDDPDKTEPGQCGCSVADTDTDGDMVADCIDECPLDSTKIEAGLCGCGVPEGQCEDLCPDDPDKTEPGICGCGVPDVDTDSDGTMDCYDLCPDDGAKVDPGDCGCGLVDTDTDSDGTADCNDGCIDDPAKTDPGLCGCGVADDDSDSDGTPDCNDTCPLDPNDDADGDGSCAPADCAPNNPAIYPGASESCNGIDEDCDGLADQAGCSCTVDWVMGHAYLFCPGPLGWVAARDFCRSYGYRLAALDSPAEDAAVVELAVTHLGDIHTWHGLNDRRDEGQFVWSGGSPSNYRNWEGNQPDNSGGEDCCHFWGGMGGLWNDRDCGDDFAFVCESECSGPDDQDGDGWADECDCAPLDPTRHPGASEICNFKDDDCDGTADAVAGCPCRAELYQGHSYLFCTDAITWWAARDDCHGLGGELVTVDDWDENAWIVLRMWDHFGGLGAWNGYNDEQSEGNWVWVGGGGGPAFWNGGEPNNNGGEDCCMWENNGLWNDIGCDDNRSYVCELDTCPADEHQDVDGDGLCADADTCPVIYDPSDSATCDLPISCAALPGGASSGLYWVHPPGAQTAYRVYCDMDTRGGGWTLVAIYGNDARPRRWSGNSYPRPGASVYGPFSPDIFEFGLNNVAIENWSSNAAAMWEISNHEVMMWVGGSTDDYLLASLPDSCNYFDGDTWCAENLFGPFVVTASDDSQLTDQAYACTTAHYHGGFLTDTYDEFGLHLIDGLDTMPDHNCHASSSSIGHQDIGRIFTSFNGSDGSYWNWGITSHWNESGELFQPGALWIR